MAKIIVDAMGGDNGPSVIVNAIKEYLKINNDVSFTVVGKYVDIKELEGLAELVDARDVVEMEAGALEVMRKKESSLYKAVNLLKEGKYDGIISAGSTGGFLSLATLMIKTIPGVSRAALVAPFPTRIKGKKVVILDVGASNENSSEELVQFALMGQLYARAIYGIEEPKVYLMANGTEGGKGSPISKGAYKILKEKQFPNFMGNIEARNALSGEADVVVCDGFSGNIFLKGCEGIAKMMSNMIKDAFKRNIWSKIGYLHVRKGIKEMSETMDYKSTGGAMLLGINAVVVKAHGNSDDYGFKSAIDVTYHLIKHDIVNKIKEGIKNNG